MKIYEKPELEIKSLVQTIDITTEDDDSNSAFASVPDSWWPF